MSLMVLINVCRYPKLAEFIADDESRCCAISVLIDLLQMFRDKAGIFNLAVHLISKMGQCSERARKVCLLPGNIKRLQGICQIMERKIRIEAKCRELKSPPLAVEKRGKMGEAEESSADVCALLKGLLSTLQQNKSSDV